MKENLKEKLETVNAKIEQLTQLLNASNNLTEQLEIKRELRECNISKTVLEKRLANICVSTITDAQIRNAEHVLSNQYDNE